MKEMKEDSNKKIDQELSLKILTAKGIWEGERFPKTMKVNELIQKVILKFAFAAAIDLAIDAKCLASQKSTGLNLNEHPSLA